MACARLPFSFISSSHVVLLRRGILCSERQFLERQFLEKDILA